MIFCNLKEVFLVTNFFNSYSINSVLSVRLREGYSIQDVSITKGKQSTLPTNYSVLYTVTIEYTLW